MECVKVSILLLLFLVLTLEGCGPSSKKGDFYNEISDWDIIYVPIIEPYRAASIDKGKSWGINTSEISSIALLKFGVSKNFIYGSIRKEGSDKNRVLSLL